MKHYQDDPRKITAKFQSTCKTCQCKINKGASIYYWPKERSAYCEKCGEQDYLNFLSAAQDEAFYNNSFC